jgi:NAD(P)H-hydrate epimerase
MVRALTAEQSRAVEEAAVASGADLAELMCVAGGAVAAETLSAAPEGDVIVLAGRGNNGGDGWVAARDLHAAGRTVRVLSLVDPGNLVGIAGEAARGAIAAGVVWRDAGGGPLGSDLAGAGVVVDALLGIGASGPLRAPLDSWAEAINECGAFVVSVDLPTGVDADTGGVGGVAVRADCTVTFTAPKRGLLLYPGAGYAGEIIIANIGIDPPVADIPGAVEVWSSDEYAALLPVPQADAHKNDRGRVLVIAGSAAYPGAAVLAARGAQRAGAGYVTLAVPESVVPIAQAHLLSIPVVGLAQGRSHAFSSSALEKALQLARDFDSVVLGPGLTLADGAVLTARGLVAKLTLPLVIDADALNALIDARELVERRSAPTVLTPHPGELARLLGCTSREVQADRVAAAATLASPSTAVVLKGAGTVISTGSRQIVNTSGSSALATAGSGDVLAGIVGAYLAQGLAPLDAGALAAYVHGRAGEAAASALTPICVTAEDIPEYLPVAMAELLGQW